MKRPPLGHNAQKRPDFKGFRGSYCFYMINISCNTAPYFKDGKSEGNVMLVNELNNLYPQKVEFYRNDTGEKIYESKAIAVGSKIERAKLDVELPAGEYECTAYFSNLDPDSGATLGVAGAIITITIQN